jgi:hypothetical protein
MAELLSQTAVWIVEQIQVTGIQSALVFIILENNYLLYTV